MAYIGQIRGTGSSVEVSFWKAINTKNFLLLKELKFEKIFYFRN
jgi:hypothetical protein